MATAYEFTSLFWPVAESVDFFSEIIFSAERRNMSKIEETSLFELQAVH